MHTQVCPSGAQNALAQQCSFYNTQPYRGYIYDTWLPYRTKVPSESCALICKSQTYGYAVKFEPAVIDGTPCNVQYQDGKYVCVDGKCRVC
jgi:hypothetical protein